MPRPHQQGDFIHLHVHSNYSLCRGANSIEDICGRASEMGFSHLALTDTNGIYGLAWFLQEARAQNLTPLVGAFLQHRANHAVMLAKNLTGYRTLCRTLTALHGDEAFHLIDWLKGNREQVILLSDDLALLEALHQAGVRDDLYAEIVPHRNRHKTLQFARKKNIPPVASQAAYFLDRKDFEVHRLLRAIDLNTTLTRIPAHELASPEAHLIPTAEMQNYFPDCPEAITNSKRIAEQCTFDLNFGKNIFPSFQGPEGQDAQTYLQQQVERGVIWRYGSFSPEVRQRMDFELDLINRKGFAPYFLVVADAVRQAPRTCGRGSAASSLVSYSLGITHVDPIKYDLFFERFLNPGRVDPPDIDVDFPWDERDDIIDYLFRKYGRSCVAMIANHNCFKARSAVREIAKVYGMPDREIGLISKKMTSYWQPGNLEQLIQTHPVYKGTELRPPWPEILQHAEKIRGYPRHLSIHCGGVVIAPEGLDHYCAVQPAKKILRPAGVLTEGDTGLPRELEHVQVVHWEKDQSEDMGLVKMDILGNRSLAVIRDARRAVLDNYGIDLDFNRINPLQDEATRAMLARGDTIGVFYVESPAMRQLQRKTGKGDFEHLVIHSSIIRPAAAVFIEEYVRRLRGGAYKPLHPTLENLLKETYGIMVYQEDVSKVAIALAGFDSSSADDLRKIVTKKHKRHQLEAYKVQFFMGAQQKGADAETCEKIWEMILSFAEYSFCKPHSASFALVSFQSAYLRVHYPAEFIAAVISNQGGYYSAFAYISEARRMGLQVLLPDINESEQKYSGRGKKVRVGLMQLKGITQNAVKTVLAERQKNGLFASFADFLSRVTFDAADIAIFIKAGTFDTLEPHKSRPELLWHLYWWQSHKKSAPATGTTLSLFEENTVLPDELPKPPAYSSKELWQMEEEILGFLLSQHPLTLYKEQIQRLRHVKGCDLHKHIGEHVHTIGWFITAKVVSTRHKQLMEFISFEDTTAIYETTFFPKVYTRFAYMMTDKRPFLLQGRVDEQFGAIYLNVEKIQFL